MCYNGPKRRGRPRTHNDSLHEYWRVNAEKKRAKLKSEMDRNAQTKQSPIKPTANKNKRVA